MKIIRRIPVRVKRSHQTQSGSYAVQLKAQVKPAVQIPVTARKITFTRFNLPDGDFLMNYYYREDKKGHLVPEDIESATHFERVVYTRDGYVIGSTIGRLTDKIHW